MKVPFGVAQVGNAVDVLYENPTLPDGAPDTGAVAAAIGDEGEPEILSVILVSLGQAAAIVFAQHVPSAVRLADVCKGIRMGIPDCARIGERIVHGTVHVPEETLGILSFDKDGVDGHIYAGLLVEEAVPDTELFHTRAHRAHPQEGDSHKDQGRCLYFESIDQIHGPGN